MCVCMGAHALVYNINYPKMKYIFNILYPLELLKVLDVFS